jgi:hypothetical protein
VLQRLRSFVFNLALYVTAIVIGLIATPALLMPRGAAVFVISNLSRLVLWLLKVTTGTRYELRGIKPEGAILVAAKHQSMWDTIAFVALLKDPAMVLKAELLWIPYYGWFSWKTNMIAINRGSGASAIRRLMTQGKAAPSSSSRKAPAPPPEPHRTTSPASPPSTARWASLAFPSPLIPASTGLAAVSCARRAQSSWNSCPQSRQALTAPASWPSSKSAQKRPQPASSPKAATNWAKPEPFSILWKMEIYAL